MDPTDTPSIPPVPDEDGRAYHAFAVYATLGSARSVSKTCEILGKKPGYRRQLERWSVAFNWQDRAHDYDMALVEHFARDDAQRYVSELEEHRKRYKKVGKDLYTVGQGLLATLARAVQGKTIRGADGNDYLIPSMELTPNTLAVVARALVIAADLEAHALGLDKLIALVQDEQALG